MCRKNKNWFHKMIAVVLAGGISLAVLGGCQTAKIDLDEDALVQDLKNKVAFEDMLEEIDEDLALSLYGLTEDQVDSMEVYMGTGAKAEEIAVLQAEEGTDVSVLETAAKNRVESLKSDFEDYIPEEMPKLEDPVLVTAGDYVILCVSGDNDNAKKVIDQYIK